MNPAIQKLDPAREIFTPERCHIIETWRNAEDPLLTIARTRVEPGVTTQWHALEGVTERYIIVQGRGRMEVGQLPPAHVVPGDTVFIPPGVPQRITNTGSSDLIFFCVCDPPFTPACYRALE